MGPITIAGTLGSSLVYQLASSTGGSQPLKRLCRAFPPAHRTPTSRSRRLLTERLLRLMSIHGTAISERSPGCLFRLSCPQKSIFKISQSLSRYFRRSKSIPIRTRLIEVFSPKRSSFQEPLVTRVFFRNCAQRWFVGFGVYRQPCNYMVQSRNCTKNRTKRCHF